MEALKNVVDGKNQSEEIDPVDFQESYKVL